MTHNKEQTARSRRKTTKAAIMTTILALLIGLTMTTTSPATAATAASANDGQGDFTARMSPQHAPGVCLSLETSTDWDGEPGVPVIQWNCNGKDGQVWEFEHIAENRYRIRNKIGQQCIGIAGSTPVPWVWQWTKCNNNETQQWRLDVISHIDGGRMVQIESVGRPDMCWDVKGFNKTGSTSVHNDRGRVQIYECKNGTTANDRNQIFFLGNSTTGGGWDTWGEPTLVTIGDSYAAGEGIQFNNREECHRNNNVYGPAFAAETGLKHLFLACSGDATAQVLDEQIPALEAAMRDASHDIVVISIGGNDVGFAPGLTCAYVHRSNNDTEDFDECIEDLDAEARLNQLTIDLWHVYEAVLEMEDRPQVYVLTYPIVFEADGEDCDNLNLVNDHEATAVDEINNELNETIRFLVSALQNIYGTRIQVVDITDSFDGLGTCSTDSHIRDLQFFGNEQISVGRLGLADSSSFHPTQAGYDLYLDALREVHSNTP